ncbi:MAG: hypothetical protein HZA59_14485 [Hydrogenophilales bacterium]|nr:hypothetical protein [Hydrogenophilales bacterium]
MGLKLKQFKPLVVGAPRSGFTLLISVIMNLLPYTRVKGDFQLTLLRHFIEHIGSHMSNSVVNTFAKEGITNDLLFNPNFRYLPGGPKWLKKDNPEFACFRKYIGVRGMGDFTLVTSHPRQLLDIDPVLHSHENPGLWLHHPGYADYAKFASVRHPIGIINSAIHSINALASEYIQKFVPPEEDNDSIRQNLAIYKFTDLDFYEGLLKYLTAYLEDFVQHKDGYSLMRWEDLISNPVPTILHVAHDAGIAIDTAVAQDIWARLDHVNLTGHHKHNYRAGHGKIGDWRYSVTNAHIEMAKSYGIEPYMAQLGYGHLEYLDPQTYTPFQRAVQAYLDRGEVYRDFPDQDLFTFAFNKSNLVSDKFLFKRYDWREHTQVERSIFTDDALMYRVWDAAEQAVAELNAFLADFLAEPFTARDASLHALAGLAHKHGSTLGAPLEQAIQSSSALIQKELKNTVAPCNVADKFSTSQAEPKLMTKQLELHFIHNQAEMENVLLQLVALQSPRKRVRVSGRGAEIAEFLRRPAVATSGATFFAPQLLCAELGGAVQPAEGQTLDAYLLFQPGGEAVSNALMEFVDLEDGVVVAPVTERHFRNQPLFLISIPKAGTHLLYELVQAFGYDAGIELPDRPLPGSWYCVEYSNSHTSARDFFIDTVRRAPFGNRHHPFPHTPTLFIYRHPLDIVVSEANYYHRDGNTAFEGYFAGLSYEERLLRLIDDPWLLGSLRERVGGFVPWLSFPNVVPLSFEELIGPNGGGDVETQTRLIWSLQIKLHVDGNARDFGDLVFNKNAATFHAGQIGAHHTNLTAAARAKLDALPKDYLEAFGYDDHSAADPLRYSRHAAAYRRRPLQLAPVRFDETPIAVEYNFLGHNIVRYRGKFFGVPPSTPHVDWSTLDIEHPGALILGCDPNTVRAAIQQLQQSK